ncbi:hypothetical protein ACHAXR_003086 [Thalassiosira sp. AJA248-18]
MGRNSINQKICDTSNSRRFSLMGVRYHDVKPSDTMSSICSKYSVTASALRQANFGLNGSNVRGGPKRLIIPAGSADQQKPPDTDKDQDEVEKTKYQKPESQGTADAHFSDDTAKVIQYHDVQPDDTLQLICLKYGIKATELRRANGFRGTNLKDAPSRLAIPNSKKNQKSCSKELTNDEKIQSLLSHAPTDKYKKRSALSYGVAVAYLESNDWDLHQAVRNMNVDMSSDQEFNSRKQTKTRIKRRSLLRSRSKTMQFN